METEVLKSIAGYGAFAILFTYLLFYVLKENSKREGKYQETISKNQEIITENQNIIGKLTNRLDVVDTIKNDVDDIKEYIRR